MKNFNSANPIYHSYNDKINDLNKWIKIFSDWYLNNEYDIPELTQTRKGRKKSPKYIPREMASTYIEIFNEFGHEPSQIELANNSEYSQTTWSRALNDPDVIRNISSLAERESKIRSDEQEKYIHLFSKFDNLLYKKSAKKSKAKEVRRNFPQMDDSIIDPDNAIDKELINEMTEDEIIAEIISINPKLTSEKLSKYSKEKLMTIFFNLS